MKLIRFIGDVHGKYQPYKKLISSVPVSIQVGDMGVGFKYTRGPRVGEEHGNPPHYAMIRGDHRFIRGNHDNPMSCSKHSQWIADGTVEDNMMFIGGAMSTDKLYRLEGYTWWPDEELYSDTLNMLVDKYSIVKPDIMVTHDCPEDIANLIINSTPGFVSGEYPSRTRQAFQSMFEIHQPKLWIFGHWHVHINTEVNGTNFICLAELQSMDIDVEASSRS